ncbi:porin [Sulfuricurvum sp.]|uniref:porin n=1 Tax=Sulfuricurvum sp. TaxID=2025608 RepID=UPI00261A9DBC|nr:porin [Sulfuricurvum sp.]MDD2265559.1 porin [Sulfuricurvum sp.]MDD2783829.1 porin [Sulfuricurvum sp.]
MKLVKMSLAAAVLLGASAFAIDNVKVSGDAKLFYGTNDSSTYSLFDKDSSYADTALRVGVTGDLVKGVSFGLTGYGVSTLGLENNLVSGIWSGAHTVTGNTSRFGAAVNDEAWLGEAWLAATLGKTTAKLGRMTLDTPLAFTETWNITPNTFEAAVLINQDIPDTTLVGAWVGKGNGGANVVGSKGTFNTFVNDGAYAAAIVNNSLKPLVAQAWYYNVSNIADAYWLQADWDCQLIKGAKVGVQYADMSPKGLLNGLDDTKAFAVKLAYAVDALNVSAAYSDVNNKGPLKVQNVATDLQGAAQSKLYTESWWSYGYVGAPDATAWNLTAEYDAKGIAKLGAYYTNVNTDWANKSGDLSEVAVTATKSFGPLDTTLAYINTKADAASSYNTLQAYLTLNF